MPHRFFNLAIKNIKLHRHQQNETNVSTKFTVKHGQNNNFLRSD